MTAQLHTLTQNGNASTTEVVGALEKIAQRIDAYAHAEALRETGRSVHRERVWLVICCVCVSVCASIVTAALGLLLFK